MARNRKRRSDGGPRRQGDGRLAEPGVATASAARRPGSPSPLEHAAPEAEIVEAQLARGRAAGPPAGDPGADRYGGPSASAGDAGYDDADYTDELDVDEPDAGEDAGAGHGGERGDGGDRGRGHGGSGGGARGGASGGGGAVAAGPPATRGGSRVVTFLQGSWRELQRVQWPDRPQVMQATGVVIGFVIIAGLFLGLSDFVAQRVVNFILK